MVSGYFSGLPNLDEIDLSYNYIADLPDRVFENVPSVRIIHLMVNQISVVRELNFAGIVRV